MIDLFGIQKMLAKTRQEAVREGFAAKVGAADRENQIYAVLNPAEAPEFLDACADLAKLGISTGQLRQIAHAIQHRRILAFYWGRATDVGEAGRLVDGLTRGSRAYEGGQV